MGPDTGEDTRVFGKDCTVILNVGDNQRVKANDVMRDIDAMYGKGSVYACVPKSGDCFEITLATKNIAEKLTEGVNIADKSYDCGLIFSDIIVVSFMHLPAYITDAEIKMKLASYGIALKGKIKRRYYRGTRCADGTRYVKCQFPKHIISLNYLMKFDTVHGPQMFRVKHNNQTKVCSICLSDGHLRKECPDFKCFRCGVQGHTKTSCDAPRCDRCNRFPVNCVCDEHDGAETENETEVSDRGEVYDVETDVDNDADDESGENGERQDGNNVHNDDMDLSVEEEIIPGDHDGDSSIDLSAAVDSLLEQTTDENNVASNDATVISGDQSSFLVDFTTPVVNPEIESSRPEEGVNFTPAPENPSEEDLSSSDDENMDCTDSSQADRRQKRKNIDKVRELVKRKKEVSKRETNPETENTELLGDK